MVSPCNCHLFTYLSRWGDPLYFQMISPCNCHLFAYLSRWGDIYVFPNYFPMQLPFIYISIDMGCYICISKWFPHATDICITYLSRWGDIYVFPNDFPRQLPLVYISIKIGWYICISKWFPHSTAICIHIHICIYFQTICPFPLPYVYTCIPIIFQVSHRHVDV
jgi:hypothetical protein